jgi:hypothetical protein
MADDSLDLLEHACWDAGLSHDELWMRYFELGGMSTALEVDGFLCGALVPTTHDHDLLAHALNERFVQLGGNHPVPYLADRING